MPNRHADDAIADFDRPTAPAILDELRAAPTPDVFDFRKNWQLVSPHLDHSTAVAALHQGMAERGYPWEIEDGPWSNSPHGDFWFQRMMDWAEESNFEWTPPPGREWPESDDAPEFEELVEMQSEALSEAWLKHGAPQPNTPDWYRCIGGCHMMAPFCAALGRLIHPELRWSVVRSDSHCVAWGRPLDGRDGGIIFDILNYESMDGVEIASFVLEAEEPRPISLRDLIEAKKAARAASA